MTAEPVRFACLLPPGAVNDPPVVEAMLSHHVLAAAERGEIELAPDWRLTDVRAEVRRSQFDDIADMGYAIGTVLGARKPSPPACDI